MKRRKWRLRRRDERDDFLGGQSKEMRDVTLLKVQYQLPCAAMALVNSGTASMGSGCRDWSSATCGHCHRAGRPNPCGGPKKQSYAPLQGYAANLVTISCGAPAKQFMIVSFKSVMCSLCAFCLVCRKFSPGLAWEEVWHNECIRYCLAVNTHCLLCAHFKIWLTSRQIAITRGI